MKMFESIFILIWAIGQRFLELHLTLLENVTKYFSVQDQYNYARMFPVHLTETFELKIKEPKGIFSINKSSFLFVAIGTDHSMEQKDHIMIFSGSKLSFYIPKLIEFNLSLPKSESYWDIIAELRTDIRITDLISRIMWHLKLSSIESFSFLD